MHAIDHLLQLSALELTTGTCGLLLASTAAAILVFMIGFRLAGLPAGAVWVLLGLVSTAGPEHDASLNDILERRHREALPAPSEARSLASLGEKVAAASAGRSVGDRRSSIKS